MSADPSRLNVLLLDTKPNNPNFYIVLGILEALRSCSAVGEVCLASYDDVMSHARRGSFDLLLAVDGENMVTEIMERLRSYFPTMALWTFEDPYESEKTAALSSLFDLIYTNDSGSVSAYPYGATHLSLAASPAMDFRDVIRSDADYDYDLAFVGSAWPNRVQFLRRLLRQLPSLESRIVLAYNPYLPRAHLDLPDSSYVGAVSHMDFVDIANRARINLTLHRDFSGDGKNPKALDPGPRIFETALAGGYQLIDAHETRVNNLFVDGVEADTFDSFEACVSKIKAALGNPHERIVKAIAAQERVQREHIYLNRVEKIVYEVLNLNKKKSRVLAVTERRPRLLFVTHNTVTGGNFGGVEVYQESIIDYLSKDYDVYFYRPSGRQEHAGQREYVVTNHRHSVLHRVKTPQFDIAGTLSDPLAEAVFAGVLSKFEIDLVHYQHLINHVLSLPIVSRMMGIPSVYTTHDFYMVCKRFNLIDYQGRYCDIVGRPTVTCDICLAAADGIAHGGQAYRRAFISRVFSSLDIIIANSPSAREVIGGVYPELEERGAFVSLGMPLPQFKTVPVSLASSADMLSTPKQAGPLKVVFLGNFTQTKGADVFIHVANAMRDDAVEFTICGRIDDPYPAILSELNLPKVKIHGAFQPGELDLSVFDMSLHLSTWPETYCITLSEAWKADVVPVVSDCGALHDRVTDGENGFVVPIDGAGELLARLRSVAGDHSELDRVRANIGPHLWITPAQHCETLKSLYTRALGSDRHGVHHHAPEVDTGWHPGVRLTGRPLPLLRWDTHAINGGDALDLAVQPPLNPAWQETSRLTEKFEAAQIDFLTSAKVWIDSIGDENPVLNPDNAEFPVPLGSALTFSGWISFPSSFSLMKPRLLLRGSTGENVILPLDLHDRPDVTKYFGSGVKAFGFQTASFAYQMLEPAIYGVEIISGLESNRPTLLCANAALIVGERSCFTHACRVKGQWTVAVAPFEGDLWGTATKDWPSSSSVDMVELIQLSGSCSNEWALGVSGWVVMASAGDASQVGLELSGNATYYIPLHPVERPDVEARSNVETNISLGFSGAAWLSGLSAGEYRIRLICRTKQGISATDTGRELRIGGDSPLLVKTAVKSKGVGVRKRATNLVKKMMVD